MCKGTSRAAELSEPKQGYLWLPKRGCNLLCYPQISGFKSEGENAAMPFDLANSIPTLPAASLAAFPFPALPSCPRKGQGTGYYL